MNITDEDKKRHLKSYTDYIRLPEQFEMPGESAITYHRLATMSFTFSDLQLDKKNTIVKPVIYTKKELNIANLIISGKTTYVSAGDIPVSADGEFRDNFVTLEQLRFAFTARVENYEYVKQFYINHKSFIISPVDMETTILILLYTIHHIGFLKINIYPNNYNNYLLKFFSPIIRIMKNIHKVTSYLIKLKAPVKVITYGRQLGSKIIPLYINDLRNINSFSNSFQKELYINNLTRKLAANGICDGYAVLLDWTIFKVTNLDIFNNTEIMQKYVNSEEYLKQLKYLYRAGEIKGELETIKTYRKKLRVPILFAEKNLILSKYCFLLIMEYVGFTFANLVVNTLEKSEQYADNNVCLKLHHAKSLIFQVAYNLLALNTRINVIHGDLHLNNVTYRMLAAGKKGYTFGGKNYIIDAFANYFVIDFGRSYIKPDIVMLDDNDNYTHTANKRLIKYFAKSLPEIYVENKLNIHRCIKSNNAEMFRVLSLLDIYYFVNSFRMLCIKYLNQDINDFLREIEIFCINYFRTNLNNVFNNKPVDNTFPNQLLLEHFYKDNIAREKSNIYSYCNLDNENKSDLFDDNLPPPFNVSIDKFKSHKKWMRNEQTGKKNINEISKKVLKEMQIDKIDF